jgi:hypothetical protein
LHRPAKKQLPHLIEQLELPLLKRDLQKVALPSHLPRKERLNWRNKYRRRSIRLKNMRKWRKLKRGKGSLRKLAVTSQRSANGYLR